MADNYLEKKMEALQARKAKEQRAKQIAWKKRMEAYRKKLEAPKLEESGRTSANEAADEDSTCATKQEGSASQG